MPGKSKRGGGLEVKPSAYYKSAFNDDSTVEHPHTHRETVPGDAGQAGRPAPGAPYKPFKMKGFPMVQGTAKYKAALKHGGNSPAGDMAHTHPEGQTGFTKEVKNLPTEIAGGPASSFEREGPPFHDPEHGETRQQTERRLREEGYSEEEITEFLTTGNIPEPGARDEQMMEEQGIEGGGAPVIEGGAMPGPAKYANPLGNIEKLIKERD